MANICGHCEHHKKADNGEWYCTNSESENYALETDYRDGCEDFEER